MFNTDVYFLIPSPVNPAVLHHPTDPKARIIEAATRLLTERGYEATSVRDIVKVAGVNLNAVNYYFGSKRDLYLAIMRSLIGAAQRGAQPRPSTVAAAPRPPEQALRDEIRRLLDFFLADRSGLARLSALEIINPSPAAPDLALLLHDEERAELTAIVAALLGPGASPDTVHACVRSVLSQCTHFMFIGKVLPMTDPGLSDDPSRIQRLADHITDFSLGAIAAMRQGLKQT